MNLSGILIFTEGLWSYISVRLFFYAFTKMNCNCLELQAREEDLEVLVPAGKDSAKLVQSSRNFISPHELPVCLASRAAPVACSKSCLKSDSSLSEVGSRWMG